LNKQYQNSFIRQQDESDCGVACLASLVKFHGGDSRIERLRELSGTDKQGTTMLGLYQAAEQIGMDPEALEGDIPNLKELQTPCILHVLIDERLQHYVICYGYENDMFVISNPASGVELYSAADLEKIWQSKALLVVKPNKNFKETDTVRNEKWFWIRKLVEDDINILSITLVLGFGISILSMVTAVFSQKLIDDILPNSHQLKLTVGLSLLFFLLLVKTGISFVRQTFLIRQGKNFNNRIINHFYGSLLHLPKSFFDNRKTGELVARLNDTMRIQAAVSYVTTNLMLDVLLVVITSCFILFYSKVLGLIALLSIPAYFVIVYVFHNRIVTSQREVMVAYAKNESNYVDTIQGVGVIKVANKESMFSEITRMIYNFFQEKVYVLGEVRIRFNFATEIMGSTLVMGIITLSSLMVMNDTLKLGQMMAILQMIGMLMPAAGRLAMTNIQLQEARVAFDRMFEFTSIPPEYNPETEKPKENMGAFESLEIRNLSFRFPGRSELLKDISFHVRKGEIITLLGESGCGKSTALQILQKFYGYENGTVSVNGVDWKDVAVTDWRNTIAVISQDIKIFNGPLLNNVCLGDEPKNPQEMIDFFKEYGFDKYFESFPQGYDTLLGEEGVNISGGQQQLVALARALYKKPQLLLMDEATSAMDRNTEGFVLGLLQKARESMGVILVTHRVKTARDTDRIYVIEDGMIKASGSHSELLEGDNLYANSWRDFQQA